MNKAVACYAAGLLCGALAVAYLRGEPPGDVRSQVDTVRINVSRFDSAEVIRTIADSLANVERRRIRGLAAHARQAADSLSTRADSLRGVLDTVQGEADSLRAAAQRLDDTRQHVADSLRAVIALDSTESAVLYARFLAADSAARSAQLLLHDALGRIELVAAKVRPRCGLAVFGGYGVRGPDIGLGFACRL